jgi:hypothetical protein
MPIATQHNRFQRCPGSYKPHASGRCSVCAEDFTGKLAGEGRNVPLHSPTQYPAVDLMVEDHGSIMLVRPISDDGRAWLNETAPEDAQFFGGAMVVEPRYIEGVIDAAQSAGMEVA